MSFRRVGWLAAIALATLLEISCGQVYRPVVIPVATTPPNPANFHAVFGISANTPANPGTALQIDVSGDTNIGVANVGMNPTHAAILPGNSRIFVASAGTINPDGTVYRGGSDIVSAFTPAADSTIATGLGTPSIFSFPNVGPIDPTTGAPAWFCSYLPDFLATTQTNSVYVANFGVENDAGCTPNPISTDSVAVLNASTNAIANISYLPAGAHPVSLVETPNGQNLYVMNQGNNTITDISPTDLSTLATIPLPAGSTLPVWAVSRLDNQRVYVVTQGDGKLYTIHTDTNTFDPAPAQAVGGPGANFVLYDKSRNRLYVINPNSSAVFVFDATQDPPAPLGNPAGITIPKPPIPAKALPCTSAPCYTAVTPVSVAALPDGSRFYVTSYVTTTPGSACTDPNLNAAGCVIPQVTVFDAGSLTVKTTVFPLLPPVDPAPPSGVQPFAVAPVTFCAPVIPYAPVTARFRMFATAAADSTRVYASICDAGSVAIINTSTSSLATGGNMPDTLTTDLPTPSSAGPPGPNNEPPLQNPLFLLTGQ